MEDINGIIGKNLLRLRKNAKLTQMELAEKFNYSDKSISKWETGESLPSIEVLYELAKFYDVTLDYLVNDNPEEKIETKTEKLKKPKKYSTKMVVTLLAVCAVWVIATGVFVSLILAADITYPLCFIWAIPASCIVLVVFNSIWGHFRYLFPILTVMLWSVLVSVHIQMLVVSNIWPVYFLGIPLQFAIILWDALVKHPKAYTKHQKELAKKKKQEEMKKYETIDEN